jgi:hypothetical protein
MAVVGGTSAPILWRARSMKIGKRARILKARIMWTGCDVHHGFQQGKGQRGAGLSARLVVGSGAPMAGGPCRKQAVC